jgi:hypothetical protein
MLFTDLLGAPKAIIFRSIDCFTGFLGLLLDLSLRDCGARAIVATARFHPVVTAQASSALGTPDQYLLGLQQWAQAKVRDNPGIYAHAHDGDGTH